MSAKVRSILAVAALIFISGTMSAQVAPNAPAAPWSITLKHGSFYDSAGLLIDSSRAESLFGTDIYSGTYLKARRQFRIGRGLVIAGSAIATPSLLFSGMMFTLFALSNDGGEIAVATAMIALGAYVAGTMIAGVGIPLMVVGKNSLVRLESDYNTLQGSLAYNPLQRPKPYLSFGSCSRGIGLALNF